MFDKKRSETQVATLTVPCGGGGASSAYLEITSSNGEGMAFRQAALTVPIDNSCAAPQCAAGKSSG